MAAVAKPGETPAFTESQSPDPPRFRWMKRIAVLTSMVIVGLVVLRLWWGHVAHQRLQAEIDAIHARGEPIYLTDFQDPPLADADNAAWYLKQAALAYVPSAKVDAIDWSWDKPISSGHLAEFRKYLQANQQALQWVRKARDHSRATWGTNVVSPVLNVRLVNLSPQRDIAQLLGIDACTMHLDGHDAEATESICDSLHQADMMGHDLPLMVTHLVMVSMSAIASSSALGIAPDLQIASETATSRPANAVSRKQIQALIHVLLDEDKYQRGAVRMFYGERLMDSDAATWIAQSQIGNATFVWLVQPMLELDAVRMMLATSAMATAASENSMSAAHAKRPPDMFPRHGILPYVIKPVSKWMLPFFDRPMRTHFCGLIDRRAAATALAIRIWQFDHNGQFPSDLKALIPEYLPSVPIDPFSKDGSPLRYKAHSTVGPIVYSVGDNGVDDGGSEACDPTIKRANKRDRFQCLDFVYRLRRQAISTTRAATTGPSSETGDDEDDE